MADEDEWKKLSTEDKVQHKAWKARAEGYKECIKNFAMWDEKSPEFSKYPGFMKKFVTDSNELIRVQGLEATLVFVENAHVAPKTAREVVSGVITKCFTAKAKHKALGIEVCLMYVERDHNEQTQEELLQGIENKNPKVVSACLETLTTALRVFGSKVIGVKPLLKQTPKLLNHRDKEVREKTKEMYIEIYKWIGQAIRTPLQNINAIVLKELEEDWEKIGNVKSKQTRFMRSQQDLKEKAASAQTAASAGNGGDAEEGEKAEEVDPYDLLDPVEVLSKLPKDFYQKIEEKKWQERKGVLESCLTLSETPKMEAGDYSDLMKALKKVVSKDTNVMLVTIAVKCVTGFAFGLKKKFQPFSGTFVDAFIEKFKEKKPTVVKALQDGIDAVYKTTTLQNILETVIEGLQNKNPVIREQTSLFLARSLKGSKISINKTLIKSICVPLLANIDHSSPAVREGSYEALGALLKRVGEKQLNPYLADVDKIKMDKISEFAGKIKEPETKNSVTEKAPIKEAPRSKPVDKTRTAAAKAAKKKPASAKAPSKSSAVKKVNNETPPEEAELSESAIEDILSGFLADDIQKKVLNMNWKERLEGLQQIVQKIKISEKTSLPCQAVVFLLGNGKPGWSDTNFNCLNTKFEILKLLAEFGIFSRTTAKLCLQILTNKIGDIKCGNASKEALTAISECCYFPWVAEEVLERSMSQKNPKIQSESLIWLSNGIKEFGMNKVDVKFLIAKIKQAIGATNPAVRNAAFALVGVLTLYIGEKIKIFFDSEKPAVVQQINSEVEKASGQTAPAPIRGIQSKSDSNGDMDDDAEEPVAVIDDMIPRVDISSKLTEAMLNKLGDKNWKIRREGLDEVTAVLNEGKFIEPALSDLPSCLKQRVGDSNKVLVTTTLNLLGQIAVALGPHCKVHVKSFISSFYKVLSDSKPLVRQAAINAMNQWLENTQLSVWLEDDAVGTALENSKYVYLRVELLNWLTEKLLATPKITAIAKDNLEASIKHLCSCCEDRSADVRTKAQGALPAYIYHLGLDKMMRACGKHSSKSNSMLALLEAAKEKVPARKSNKPLKPRQKIEIDIPVDEPTEKSTLSQKESCKGDADTAIAKPKSKVDKNAKAKKSAHPSKSEKVAEITELITPNSKEQRIKDEAKLKTLKWIFQSPREELIIQLKTQCATCMSKDLTNEMFHNDFQHHIKAITMLTGCLTSSWPAFVSTFDLILRWATLRFYETNTTVHVKCLEFLTSAFEHLVSENVRLTDYEANSFIPHLIIKIGENKDKIRKGVHTIIQLIGKVYPASKIFIHLMSGLVSKNSRQRSECLDEISILISNHGIDVCQPTPLKALKELATHIGDRDKGVRSAALNVVVEAYNVCGEVVYKYVGKLSDKDMGMLEERIKRSGKYVPDAKSNIKPPLKVAPAPKETTSAIIPEKVKAANEIKINTSDLHSSGTEGSQSNQFEMPQLLNTECEDLLNFDPQLPANLLSKIEGFFIYSITENNETTLVDLIVRLTNKDFSMALVAVHQLNAIWEEKEKKHLLKDKLDQIFLAAAVCIRNFVIECFSKPEMKAMDSNMNKFYKSLIWMISQILEDREFAVLLSSLAIEDITQAILLFVSDPRFNSKEFQHICPAYLSTINKMIHNIISDCDLDNLMCAYWRLFGKTCLSSSDQYLDLVRKCIWKMIAYRCGDNYHPVDALAVLKEINKLCGLSKHHPKLSEKMNYRTIKSFVLRLCEKLGPTIVTQVNQLEEDKTELAHIVDQEMAKRGFNVSVDKTCSTSNLKENKSQVDNLSLDARLSAIFKKIGDREMTRFGLEELYIFKKENPFYDIEPEIRGVSPLFRDYITNGLKRVEEEKLKNVDYKPMRMLSAKEHSHRLALLRAKCGLGVETDSNKPTTTVLTANTSALNRTSHSSESIKASAETTANQLFPRPSTAPSRHVPDTEDLKRRLEKIRNYKKH